MSIEDYNAWGGMPGYDMKEQKEKSMIQISVKPEQKIGLVGAYPSVVGHPLMAQVPKPVADYVVIASCGCGKICCHGVSSRIAKATESFNTSVSVKESHKGKSFVERPGI